MLYIPAKHKPKFGQAGIIPAHPLVPDFFLALNEGGGNQVWDFISKKPYDFDVTYSPSWNEVGVEFNSNHEHIIGPPLNEIFSAGSNGTILFGFKDTGGSPYLNYFITVDNDPSIFLWNFYSASNLTYVYINGQFGSSWQLGYLAYKVLGITWEDVGGGIVRVRFYGDGKYLDYTDLTTSFPNSSYPILIGSRNGGSNTYFAGGIYKYLYIKDKRLSYAEIASLSANPYRWMYDKSEMLIRSVWAVNGGSTYNMTMSESSSVTDALGGLVDLASSIAESNNIADSFLSVATFIGSISESNAISDLFSSAANFIGSISELNIITDSQSSSIDFLSSIFENMNISENLNSLATMFVSLSESNNIQDTLAAIGNFTHSINESVTIEDAFRTVAAIAEFVKIFGEVGLSSLIKGSVSKKSDISGEVDKENIVRGDIKNGTQV